MLAVVTPENAQAYNAIPSSARTASGIAVATAIASNATRNTSATIPIDGRR
jgi:hypothetical protein